MATGPKDAVPAQTGKRARQQPNKLRCFAKKQSNKERQAFLDDMVNAKVEQAIRLLRQHSTATPRR